MLLQFPRVCAGATQFRVQKSPQQVSQAPCPQRPDSSFLCFSWSPSYGREATRWSDTRPVAERKVDVLGRHCYLSSYVSGAAIETGSAAEDAAS